MVLFLIWKPSVETPMFWRKRYLQIKKNKLWKKCCQSRCWHNNKKSHDAFYKSARLRRRLKYNSPTSYLREKQSVNNARGGKEEIRSLIMNHMSQCSCSLTMVASWKQLNGARPRLPLAFLHPAGIRAIKCSQPSSTLFPKPRKSKPYRPFVW